jgi:hypothetical protein
LRVPVDAHGLKITKERRFPNRRFSRPCRRPG